MKTGSEQWERFLIDGARQMNINITNNMAGRFSLYALELLKWNNKINLTAITNPKDMAVKHFLDSIAPLSYIPAGSSLLDIGSGAGFPGIPLKIVMPDISCCLVDSSRKKVSFLKQLFRVLKLDNIDAYHTRAEDLNPEAINTGKFDVVISRALSRMDRFVSQALPLLKNNGRIIALKGRSYNTEIKSLQSFKKTMPDGRKMNYGNIELDVHEYTLPFVSQDRFIIIIKIKS